MSGSIKNQRKLPLEVFMPMSVKKQMTMTVFPQQEKVLKQIPSKSVVFVEFRKGDRVDAELIANELLELLERTVRIKRLS